MGFSNWTKWDNREDIKGIKCVGTYVLALVDEDISQNVFSWRKDIIYIGMTNSVGGLRSRLRQFHNTISGGEGHGGAKRVKTKYCDYGDLTTRLYVSVFPRECNVLAQDSKNIRVMGEVAKHEYDCLAEYVKLFEELPEFNDKKRSPKK